MSEIVKVQPPGASNVESMADVALIYGKGRSRVTQQPIDAITKRLMCGDAKRISKPSTAPIAGCSARA